MLHKRTREAKVALRRPTHLLDVLDALDDIVAFHRLLDGVGVAQDAQVLLQCLLHQAGRQSGEVGQLPQHLQDLSAGIKKTLGRCKQVSPNPREATETHLPSGSLGAGLPADPPDQTEQLLPHTVAFDLPALQ